MGKVKRYLRKLKKAFQVLRCFISSFHKLPQFKGALFIHDAHKHGAQLLGLSMIKDMAERYGQDNVVVFLLGSGDLESSFQKYNCIRCSHHRSYIWHAIASRLNAECFLIFNSVATQSVSKYFLSQRRKSIALVHELPTLIKEYSLKDLALQTYSCDIVVFPGDLVKTRFLNTFKKPLNKAKVVVFPQGVYQGKAITELPGTIKQEINIPTDSFLVANIAYGDTRKAPDVFVLTAITYFKKHPSSKVHFVWVGEMEQRLRLWLTHDIEMTNLSDKVHFLNFRSDAENLYKSIDCLYLSSREDPLPSTVLETYFAGKPVVLFTNCTGYNGISAPQFTFIDYQDLNMAVDAINRLSVEQQKYSTTNIFYSSREYLDKINGLIENEL